MRGTDSQCCIPGEIFYLVRSSQYAPGESMLFLPEQIQA